MSMGYVGLWKLGLFFCRSHCHHVLLVLERVNPLVCRLGRSLDRIAVLIGGRGSGLCYSLKHLEESSQVINGRMNSPSPLSLADSTMKTYLINGMRISVYRMRDKTPKRSSVSLIPSRKVLEYTYRGDVPMSPYTTPMLWNAKSNVVSQLTCFTSQWILRR